MYLCRPFALKFEEEEEEEEEEEKEKERERERERVCVYERAEDVREREAPTYSCIFICLFLLHRNRMGPTVTVNNKRRKDQMHIQQQATTNKDIVGRV